MQLAAKITFDAVEPDGDDERLHDRTKVRLAAEIHDPAQIVRTITVHDLSADGFSAIVDQPLPVAQQFEVTLSDTVSCFARVVRQDRQHVAARFVTSLTPGELRRAISASTVQWADFAPPQPFVRATGTAFDPAVVAEDTRWPRPVRAALIIGLPIVMWSMLLAVIR